MTITLRPEQEAMIEQAIRRGAYQDAEEVISRALEILQSEDEWLFGHKDEINEKIERALRQFEEGQFFTPEESKADLARRKAEWLAARRP